MKKYVSLLICSLITPLCYAPKVTHQDKAQPAITIPTKKTLDLNPTDKEALTQETFEHLISHRPIKHHPYVVAVTTTPLMTINRKYMTTRHKKNREEQKLAQVQEKAQHHFDAHALHNYFASQSYLGRSKNPISRGTITSIDYFSTTAQHGDELTQKPFVFSYSCTPDDVNSFHNQYRFLVLSTATQDAEEIITETPTDSSTTTLERFGRKPFATPQEKATFEREVTTIMQKYRPQEVNELFERRVQTIMNQYLPCDSTTLHTIL